jgi:hypothetical protein
MASYVAGVGTNGGSRYINSSQGFWVKATAASPQLLATESVKTSNATSFLRQTEVALQNESLLRLHLHTLGTDATDEVVLRFNPQAQPGVDPNLDAYDFTGIDRGANLMVLKEGAAFSISSSPTLDNSLQVPLQARVSPNTAYAILSNGLSELEASYPSAFADNYLVMVDNSTGAEYAVSGTSPFVFSTGADDSLANFTLRFHTTSASSVKTTAADPTHWQVLRDAGGYYIRYEFDREESFSISIANTLGQTVIPAGTYRGKNGKIYLPAISEASAGLYLVQMRCGEVQHTAKLTR